MIVTRTHRLDLRQLTADDAAFILKLVNEPPWLRFIGDKHVRSLADAQHYLHNGPLTSYAHHGFGLWKVERREDGQALGMCGLIKRETLDDVDLGFALHELYWGHGYAREAAAAALEYGLNTLKLPRIVAITSLDNDASGRVLESIGLRREGDIRLPPASELVRFYSSTSR